MSKIELCAPNECTGCKACANVCSSGAIEFHQDSEGFFYPEINNEKCVGCEMCMKVCPMKAGIEKNSLNKVFACWNKDENIRLNSSSGGLFTALATLILNKNGVVFGVSYNSNLKAEHIGITKIEDLKKLRYSKYVQSDVGKTFVEALDCLKCGKTVLYSGTPCQIAGLKNFIGTKNYSGELFTCDLICHGVPSPRFYFDYLHYMENKFKSKPVGINLRLKKPDWYVFSSKIDFANGKTYISDVYTDPYLRGFLRELVLRPSCSGCKFTSTDRVADITMADFWGYKSTCDADRDDNKGISLALINTEKGNKLFNEAKSELVYFSRDMKEAINGNLCLTKPYPTSPNRERFWNDYNSHGFAYVKRKYLYPEKPDANAPFIQKIIGRRQYNILHDLVLMYKHYGLVWFAKKVKKKLWSGKK